ncbi:MAG: ABC transporter permease [Phocaeicola sp.]|uniref:ABC transporter permease n=1 Tax=Phocaeicola sp. TaxID=2773926 RepID=UPI003FA13BD4
MKTIIRNFTSIFRRFVMANLLNILGLSLAFAAFFVIMTQVSYDNGYNKSIKDYRNLYQISMNLERSMGDYTTHFSRPIAEALSQSSPHVKSYGLISQVFNRKFRINEKEYNLQVMLGINDFPKIFEPEIISGNLDRMKEERQIVVTESAAKRMFGSIDVVNKTITLPALTEENPDTEITICAIVKDYPDNTFFYDCCFIGSNENEGNGNNWNYYFYVRLDDAKNVKEVNDLFEKKFIQFFKEKGTTDKDLEGLKINFMPIADTHFSKGGTSSKSSVYLLFCFSILIILIAGVNFMNFTLAETPMRIRSINTQKILGATAAKLKGSLLAEAVFISLIAYALSLIWVVIANDMGLQHLVDASIRLDDQKTLLLLTFLISVTVGLLAGAYPSYYVTSFPPALVLKGSFGLSPKGRILRAILISIQFIISFILIIAVGIMYLQSHYIFTSDYGYDKDMVMVASTTRETRSQPEAVINRMKNISGVEDASFSQFIMSSSNGYMTWGRGTNENDQVGFAVFFVDSHFPNTLGLKIVEGRGFKEGDGDVYMFSESMKKKYPFVKVDEKLNANDFLVVGFFDDLQYASFRQIKDDLPLGLFISSPTGKYKDWGNWRNVLNIRVGKNVDKIAARKEIQKALEEFTPHNDFNVRSMDQVIENNYQHEFLYTKQIVLFSLLAILISIIGVFGLTMFESEYRRKEIGIRKIMGSSTKEILYMFNKRYIYMLIGCFVFAAPVGYLFGHHWLEGFAQQTNISLLVFLVAFLLVTFFTMLTVTFQSWKNANENPINSIKTE